MSKEQPSLRSLHSKDNSKADASMYDPPNLSSEREKLERHAREFEKWLASGPSGFKVDSGNLH